MTDTDNALAQVLGQNIAKYRSQMGLTQAQLSEQIGVSVAFISRVERGEKMMKIATLRSMAQALHVSCDALLSPEGPSAHTENILCMLSQQSPQSLPKLERLIRFYVEEFGEEAPPSVLI